MQTNNKLIDTCLAVLLLTLAAVAETSAQPGEPVELDITELKSAIAAQAQHEGMLMRQSGVRAVGVGLLEDGKSVGIQIFVLPSAAKAALPASLDGVPVRFIESPGFVAHDGSCTRETPCNTGAFDLPVPMGVSTGNPKGKFAGTLGFRAHRIGDAEDVGYITNNHVASASGPDLCPAQLNPTWMPGFNRNQCQPGLLDAAGARCRSPRIGGLVQVIPLVMGGDFLNTADTAFVKSQRGCVSKSIKDIGAPSGKAEFPKLGSTVKMSGRTSGLKKNKVTTVNVSVVISYGNCGIAKFVNQAFTTPIDSESASLPGDSGAPVVKGTDNLAVGINFAGDGFLGVITPMPLILNALGLVIDTAADAEPPASCFFSLS